MSLNGSFANNNNQAHVEIQLASRGRMINNTPQNNNRRTDNRVKAEASSGQSNPIKASRTHNELHKELLLAHKRPMKQCKVILTDLAPPSACPDSTLGLVLSSRSELQQVLERRKRVQTDHEEEGHTRTPLEDELLRRQQKQLEVRQNEQKEKVQEESQLMEFVRVRQNLRKIHSVIQNKATNS
ncbi:hypothetical protein PAMP_012754 [Pampus punctatissimus]